MQDDEDQLDDTVLRASDRRRATTAPGPLDDTLVRPGRHRTPASSRPDQEADFPTAVPSIRIGARVYRLDRPVVVGRRPGPPRVVQGSVPELVTVPSPGGVVSSSHVLFHAAGSTAVVDDLHATNGTVVRAPGAPPHRMPSGASMVVLTGTVVDIGDGATIEVLSPYLRSVPPGGRESSGPLLSPPSTTGPSRTPRERP
ncbi:hypothetical protein [Curtobacterium sp. MCBD17_030]|uniref:hypothetical protein n=1 Tax=Curtobacterium sp. MCBD17_030 TaxID=2175649 RepID=UPI000D9D2323|nr:hypothetical protein [Curtobacterium sp. MCBD17_030]PYY38418.1 hypothetical protein DEI89_00885 [Curtobacterium sp. MCBD17_030]